MNVRFISLILGLMACLPLGLSASQDVRARFEKSLKEAKSLGSVEIEFLDTLWMPNGATGKEGTPFFRTFQYSYLVSGSKYRATVKLISGSATNLVKLSKSAFDGESYSSYDEDIRYMTRRIESPPGDRGHSPKNPLVAPFMFLSRHSDDCLPCVLRFTDIVREATNRMAFQTEQMPGGLLEISLPGLIHAKQPTTWKVVLDENGDSFTPRTITMIAPGGKVQVVSRLLNYTNLGAYQFPTRMEWTMSPYPPATPPTVVSTGTVTVISARIPEQVADSLFKLDGEEQAAAVVWDWDRKNLIKSAPQLARIRTASKGTRIVLVLLMLFPAIIIPIIAIKKSALKKKQMASESTHLPQ